MINKPRIGKLYIMAKIEIKTVGWKCERCDHEWIPRDETPPKVCPKCKSPYWENPPRRKGTAKRAKAGG